jgi:hypothetical protein
MTLLSEVWDTTRMRLLVEIDRRGSLSAAAQAVGIGQPSRRAGHGAAAFGLVRWLHSPRI